MLSSNGKLDLSLLTTCKAFSYEAIDVLYTQHTFSLTDSDIKTIFDRNAQAHRIQSVKIIDCEPIVLNQEGNAASTFALLDFLAEKCSNLVQVGVPYTLATFDPDGPSPMPSRVFSDVISVKLGLLHARFDIPRYDFSLLMYNKLLKEIWQSFLKDTIEGIPIELQIVEQGAALFLFSGLSLDSPKDKDLVWPAATLLGVFEEAFRLYDHDKVHPQDGKEFDRVPVRLRYMMEELAASRDDKMPPFRKLAESKDSWDLDWLHDLLAIVLVETKSWMYGDGAW